MRRILAMLAVVTMSALGACGGSDDPASSADAATSAPGDSEDPGGSGGEALSCAAFSVDQVGTILGGTVTAEEDPSGGCQFSQEEDPRAPSVGISGIVGAGGGFEATKSGNVTDGPLEELSGIGGGAWIAIGRTGGDNIQAQGAAVVGDQLINLSLIQGNGLDAATVKKMAVDLLTLAASKA